MLSEFTVGIVGGGLVGALEACLLAQRGFKVTLFESRHDGRNEPSYYGRSINLAISLRGQSALKRLGYEHVVDERAIPMRARMIHNTNGLTKAIPYDPDGRCIYSIERAGLNNFLLDKAEKAHNISIMFNHVLVDLNAETGELAFKIRRNKDATLTATGDSEDKLRYYKFDLVLGCDGARSSVRSLLARQSQQMDTSQMFIEHGYLELRIDPNEDGSYKMPPNYLHIWPRGQYMMIALPNKDSSFTCTLFMPYKILDEIKEPTKALNFFRSQFQDSVELIGEKRIMETLASVRPSALISIRCKPYHFKNKVALLGDSAHAMVPFYGQGMNCGFEDCLTLDELFDQFNINPSTDGGHEVDRDKVGVVLQEYTNRRCPNGHSMCDLAMYNYVEMRDLVNSWSFLVRKHLDNLLYRLFPTYWIPLYTMVTFSRIPIDECIRRREKQDKLLGQVRVVSSLPLLLGAALLASRICRK